MFFVGPQVAQKNIVKEAWFVATLIGVIGGVLWLVLCILSVWLYRRRKSCKKMPKNTHPGGKMCCNVEISKLVLF